MLAFLQAPETSCNSASKSASECNAQGVTNRYRQRRPFTVFTVNIDGLRVAEFRPLFLLRACAAEFGGECSAFGGFPQFWGALEHASHAIQQQHAAVVRAL
jgi:hypothetical protein